MKTELDRREFLTKVPAGLAVAGLLGTGGAMLLRPDAASAESRLLGSISIPRIGLDERIYAGIGSDALSAGIGHGSWSAAPGAAGHTQLFGHRTSKGGRFRGLHLLDEGDAIVVNGATYRVRDIEVISADDKKRIWNYAGSGRRLSLIACSKANGMPTSRAYRICVRANG